MNKDVLVNERIRAKSVRVVTEDGKQEGVFRLRDAIERARASGLDLVQISAAETPVCRICDAGKFMFDRKKSQRESARRQRELTVEVKEIQLRPATEAHDLQVKSKRAQEFLNVGDKVKLVMRFRGREKAFKNVGRETIQEFLAMLGEYRVDRDVADNGKDFQMILAPMKTKADLIKEKHTNIETSE